MPHDEEHAGPMVMRGKALRGWLRVDAEGVCTDAELRAWVGPALGYARSVP